jgi:hypothetical protein
MSSSSVDRLLVGASFVVAAVAVLARMHGAVAYPVMQDFDAGGHAINVLDLHAWRFPSLRGWSGSHPPLYYAIGAALWALLPERIPVHVTLRLLSAAAWVASVGLVWRALGRFGTRVDAAVVGALLLCIPGWVITSCMMTNDALCALFVTATLVRLLDVPDDPSSQPRHAILTAVLAGLAVATKLNGAAAVAMAMGVYAWRSRRQPLRALWIAVVVGVIGLGFAGVHLWRLVSSIPSGGSLYALLGGRLGSQEKEAISMMLVAKWPLQALYPRLSSLVYAAVWADPTAAFLPRPFGTEPLMLGLARGAVPVVMILGLFRLVRRSDILRRTWPLLIFSPAYLAALLPTLLDGPYIFLTKVNYLMPLILPVGVLLALGLCEVTGILGMFLRIVLLLVAIAGVVQTTPSWRDETRTVRARVAIPASDELIVRTVERYFDYRTRDPIRAANLLTRELHLAHGLRMASIVGMAVPPETGLGPGEEREVEFAQARMAWLQLYNLLPWTRSGFAGFEVKVVEVRQNGDKADVSVHVGNAQATPPPGVEIGLWPFPEFEQGFTVERTEDGWRIAGANQEGIRPENYVQAFAVFPSAALLDSLRAIGWRSAWEG